MAKTKATIASGGTLSAEVDLQRRTIVGLIMPAAFDGTTVKFHAYREASDSFVIVKDVSGADVSITVGVDRHVVIPQTTLYGLTRVKLLVDAQGADRVIELVLR